MDKRSLFLKRFGFQLHNLIPISLHLESEINESIFKNIIKSRDFKDYYTNYNKIDLYIYSHEDQSWIFLKDGVQILFHM